MRTLISIPTVVVAVVLSAIALVGCGEQTNGLSEDQAVGRLSELLKKVDWSNRPVGAREKLAALPKPDLKETLPDIDRFELVVRPQLSGNDVTVEIFASTEKSGTGTDGWLVEAAREFNSENKRLSGGQGAKVKIRKIASGTGYQFIASRKYVPDGFSPSNHLWIQMAAAHGVTMSPIREKLVGNIAGVVLKAGAAKNLRSTYGSLDVKNLIDAVVQGNMVMGYTNPFASSTGLNFLQTVLATFSNGDESKMLSPEVVSAFESFQQGVPFVAMTTLQMRESVEKGGSLDAFVMEYQTFARTEVLNSGYEFIPFGIRHDNPLYAVGDLNTEKLEVLEKFAAFAGQARFQKLADEYGFNPSLQYDPPFPVPAGDTLVQAQKIWKEKKDAGRPIAAIFLCDVSGSMSGTRIRGVKEALRAGAEFIASGNSIGLVLFDDKVRVVLPIKKFDLNQKAAFYAAVKQMQADGSTFMYDGVAVSLDLLLKFEKDNPDIKPILFVLTDGDTSGGLGFDAMKPVIEGIKIPVYTIGYEANLDELRRLSSLVEAASLNAQEGDVQYKIGALLNAQM